MLKLKERFLADNEFTIPVTLLALATGVLTFWGLGSVSRSEYYAEIPLSMSKSLSNFFFGVLDPAGTVTLDKIPGSYWIPAIFVKIFGFSTWAITAPNALAAIGSVVVIAATGRKLFGRTAGIIAGAIAATTPILIAVSRSNQPETFFLLTLSIAAFYAVKAIQEESRRTLVIAGALIALSFHTYMLEAWALWPALIIAWFFTSRSVREKFIDLLMAGTTSLLLSLTWILIVWAIPASHRPYIGGTYHNNPFEMVFGYNGLGRFKATSQALSSATDDPTFRSFTPPFGGSAGWGRLFSYNVAGQISWLIPTAVVGIVILFVLKFNRALTTFLSLFFLTLFAMFSLVAGIHQFYTTILAIPVALLIALSVGEALVQKKHIYIVALLNVAGLSALYFSSLYGNYMHLLAYIQGAIVVATVLVIFIEHHHVARYVIPTATILALSLTPAAWSFDAPKHSNSINPVAGDGSEIGGMRGRAFAGGPNGTRANFGNMPPRPQFNGQANGQRPPQFNGQRPSMNNAPMGGGFGQQDNSSLVKYLKKNRGSAKYLLVTFGAQTAASFITATGDNVMPIGGFDGSDPTPTFARFKELVQNGEIRYVLMPGTSGMRGGPGGAQGNTPTTREIKKWVSLNCTRDTAAPSTGLYLCAVK
jgi:4-amino-4-deoxy-L-arabinose transferase-like glycosyltransferase